MFKSFKMMTCEFSLIRNFCILNSIFSCWLSDAGLAIDEAAPLPDAIFGAKCNVHAYKAFREPLMMIQVKKAGEDEEQQREASKLAKYNYTNPNTKKSLIYSYIPEELKPLTCQSKDTPLMCKETDKETGDGHCVCLVTEVYEVDDDRGPTNHIIRTEPFTTKFTFQNTFDMKLFGFGFDRKRAKSSENLIKLEHVSKNTKEFASSDSSTSPSHGDGNGTETNRKVQNIEDVKTHESKDVQNVVATISHVKCLAKRHTFCQTPFIECQPWKSIRNRMDSYCVLSRCGGFSRGTVKLPEKFFFLLHFTFLSVLAAILNNYYYY